MTATSVRARARHPAAGFAGLLACLLALLALAALASLAIGARPISPAVVWDALRDAPITPDISIVRDNRVPRTLLGIVAGAALGVAGALMQAITRNPLAEPGLLGVNAGAAFAIIVSVLLIGPHGTAVTVWFALFGAAAAAVVVWLVGGASRAGGDPARLALAGVALGAVLYGFGQGIALTNAQAFARFRAWQLGTLDARSFEPLVAVTPLVAAGLVLALLLGRSLNAVALGEDVARAVGAHVGRVRIGSVLAITLLAGAATAAVGPIGFIGLLVPHLVRPLVGRDQRRVLLASLLAAPALLLAADVVARVAAPGEVPVGVATSFIGAPALVLLARGRKVRAL